MDFAKLGLFKIIRILGPVIYKLVLLNSIKIIKIWYILVLELVDPEISLIKNMLDINPKS